MADSFFAVTRAADLGVRAPEAYPRQLRLDLVALVDQVHLGGKSQCSVTLRLDECGRAHLLVCAVSFAKARELIDHINTWARVTGMVEIADAGELEHQVIDPVIVTMRHSPRHAAGQRRLA